MLDDGSPTLEVGFAIDPTYEGLFKLQEAMDSTEAKVMAEAANIERATRGMVNLGSGTAQFTAFGNAATKELRDINREKAATTKSGEALVRQLEREASTLGKTRDQIREMRIETIALNAAEQGNVDLADRLLAAARKRQAAADAVAEAEMKAAEAAKAAAEAATFGDRADRLRAQIDPAVAAQQRFNREMAEARTLVSAGAISLDEYVAKLRLEQNALDAAGSGHERLGKGANATRYAMQGASYQVQDFITQVSMGANPVNALAVQGGQLAGQFSNIEGKAGSLARFFLTGWGLAITAGLMVLGPLVAKLMEQNNELDDAVDKLKKDAHESEVTREAKERFKNTVEGVRQAILDQKAALDESVKALHSEAEQANIAAKSKLELEINTRKATKALLDQAIAQETVDRQRSQAPGQRGELGTLALDISSSRVSALQARLAEENGLIIEAEKNLNRSRVDLAAETAEQMATEVGKVTREYDQQIAAKKRLADAQARAGKTIDSSLTQEIQDLYRRKQAAIDAAQAQERLNKASQNQIGRNIDLTEARRIAESVGGRVTSGLRDRETQQRLYDKYMAYKNGTGPWAALAAKPGTSNHERGQAIDIAKGDGITLKKLVAAYRAAGVSLTEALDEGDHYHLAWKKVGAAAQAQSAEIRAAQREATDAEATKAQTDNLYKLSEAYAQSGGAAMVAAARVKSESEAIRAKGDIEASVARDIALAIAQRVSDASQSTAAMKDQAAAQASVNAQVAAGLVPAERANELVQAQMQDLPLLAAIEAANLTKNAEGAKRATKALEDQRAARAKLTEEERRAAAVAAAASGKDRIAELQEELRLVGATDAARTAALATLRATQEAEKLNPEDRAAYIAQQVEIAKLTAQLATAQDNYNASLSYTRDLLSAIGDQAGVLSGVLSNAFGGFGDSIGGLLTTLTDLQSQQQSISDWRRDEMKKAGGDATRLAQIEVLAAKASNTAQMKATASAIAGVKSLFKEKSTAFKVMSAIEKAYAVWQAAETIASMVRDATKTASHVANSGIRTTANTAEGGSKIFAELGPWAFPVVAAMVAVLAMLGAKGGGGVGSGPSIPTSDDLQDQAGTGTVLGDSKAKSDSIAHSLELVAANTNKDLEFSNAMLKALRSIDTSIATMAGTVARQIQVSGSMFDTSGLGLGETAKKGFLGLFGGSSTSKTLWDLGMTLNSGSLADIIANGIEGQTYQVIQKIKTKKGFLGIGGGTKTSYKTTYGALDSDIVGAISDVLSALRNGLVTAAGVIGLEGAEAILDSFQVSIGKISFKDMTGEEIESQLNAIFSSIGDQMAGKLLPSLESMQLVGEGLFETFIRVAKEYEAVDVALKSIGRTFGAVGVESIGARDALVQLFGGLEDFIDATNFFRDNFLSEAEQVAPIQAAVVAELQRLGLSGITTRDQFKQMVLGLDLTTEAGREAYAALLAMAPAFDKVLNYQEQAQKATIDGLKQTIEQFSKFAESLKKYRDGLFATDAAQGNAYAKLKAQFSATAALAATGDATALGGLESAGKAFLDSARNNASSREQYLRDVALVARGVDAGIFAAEETADYAQLQLDALGNAVSILTAINANTAATASALGGSVTTPTSGSLPTPATSTAPSGTDLVDAAAGSGSSAGGAGATGEGGNNDALIAQNETLIRQNAQMVESLTKLERYWSRVDGDGLLVRTDADTPLNVVAD